MQASSMSGHTGDLDSAISKMQEKLQKERNMLNSTRRMQTKLTDPNARANAETLAMDAERRIQYLQAELDRLVQKKQHRTSASSMEGETAAASAGTVSRSTSGGRPHSLSLSKLDLRKASSSLSMQKISLKVHEIAYKLEVERKIREKANRIRTLYSNDYRRGSKGKITQIIDSGKMFREAEDRIRLLEYSLKMYQSLYVDYVDEDDATLNDDDEYVGGLYQPAIRRPMTGKLQLRVTRAMYLRRALARTGDHRSIHPNQHYIVVKVDGKNRGVSNIVRDATFNYYFEADVKKASEVELSIFERSDQDYLVGLMWIRLSDIYEDIRRKQMIAESSDGWATADQVAHGVVPKPKSTTGYGATPSPISAGHSQHGGTTPGMSAPGFLGAGSNGPGVISTWDVESQGQIELWVNFIKETPRRRQASRLGRKAAVRKNKGQCMEMCGHFFYQFHTYTIMKCAVCGEHIVNDIGQQCDECQMFVHTRCVPRVVMHCLSAQTNDGNAEDPTEIIKHKIPHRWEQTTNMGANWCCHCGYMLTIGRRVLKCSECNTTCHSRCMACVPNFCGLDMMRASEMVQEVKRAKGSIVPQPKLLNKRDTVARKQDRPIEPLDISTMPTIPDVDSQVTTLQNKLQQMHVQQQDSGDHQQALPHSHYSQMSHLTPQQQQHDRMSSAVGGHQRTGSNGFIPISSPSKTGQQQQQPIPPQSGVQAPSYYQQQIQQIQQNKQHQQQAPPNPFQKPASPHQAPGVGGTAYPYNQQHPSQSPQPQHGSRPVPPPPPPHARPSPQSQSMHSDMQMQGGVARNDFNDAARQQIHQVMQQPPHQQQLQKQPPPQKPTKVGVNDFKFLKVLGKGNFGKVMLSEEKSSGKLYAIKVLKKEFIVENDEFESTRSEKRVLLIANKERHPFLIGLHSCFQTAQHIFFAMEYISGGDLMMHVQKLGSFGERRAKFFACEILLALGYFHSAGIIYRDLKLDNIMLDAQGHIKIADYGLCKENMGYGATTSTFCVDSETPVGFMNGFSVRIKDTEQLEGNKLLSFSRKSNQISDGMLTRWFDTGVKSCVELRLLDGRTVSCTEDHRVLTDKGWKRADDIVIGHDVVYCGASYPVVDLEANYWWRVQAGDLLFSMVSANEVVRSMAFARIVGLVMSNFGTTVIATDDDDDFTIGVPLESKFDADVLCEDIAIVLGKDDGCVVRNTALDCQEVALPSILVYAIASLASCSDLLPSFIADPNCPLSIVQAFLSGLLSGSGGVSCDLKSFGLRRARSSGLANTFAWDTIYTRDHAIYNSTTDTLLENMDAVIGLFERCGVERLKVSQGNSKSGASRFGQLAIQRESPFDDTSLLDNVSFSYSYRKQMRAEACTAYIRYRNTMENLIDSDTASDAVQQHILNSEQFLREIGALDVFEENKSALTRTPFAMTVVSRLPIGMRAVNDLTINGRHSFLASGVVVHNCGTPQLMAPEIVLEQRYGRAVDWWAFGVLIYEMILGTSPFHGEDENEIFDSILEDEILYPVKMSRDSVFICQALLEREPSKRLGSGPNDAEDIKGHPFFKGTNWDDVLNKRVSPLYVPEIRGRFDVSNFDPEFTAEKPRLTPTNTIIAREDQVEFSDFDYVSPWAGKSEKWTR